jgi:hypothetical protein
MAPTRNIEIELTSYVQHPTAANSGDIEPLHNHDVNGGDEGFSLPPTDGGKDAWLCLFACFMLEAMLWGKHHQVHERGKNAQLCFRLPIILRYLPGILQRQ